MIVALRFCGNGHFRADYGHSGPCLRSHLDIRTIPVPQETGLQTGNSVKLGGQNEIEFGGFVFGAET